MNNTLQNKSALFSQIWVRVLLLALFLPVCLSALLNFLVWSPHPDCYMNFYIKPIDLVGNSRALHHCKERFEAGDARSGFWLGYFYAADQDDEEQAFEYWKQAAEMGDAWALHMVGFHNLDTSGFPNDTNDKSLAMIKQSADMGFSRAQFAYAHIYDRVFRDNRRNLEIAWEYYNRAADNGNEFAMIKLSDLYLYGDSVAEKKIKNCQISPQWRGEGLTTAHDENNTYTKLECNEEKGVQYLKDAVDKVGSMEAMNLLRKYYRDEKSDEVLETYWLLQMSRWESDSEFIKEEFPIVFTPVALSKAGLKAYATKQLKQKDKKIIEQAKAILPPVKQTPDLICSYPDYSWYYAC